MYSVERLMNKYYMSQNTGINKKNCNDICAIESILFAASK